MQECAHWHSGFRRPRRNPMKRLLMWGRMVSRGRLAIRRWGASSMGRQAGCRGTPSGSAAGCQLAPHGCLAAVAALVLILAGCGAKGETSDPRAEAPPPAQVEQAAQAGIVKVDSPEQFPLVTATARDAAPELNVTGVVAADVARTVPVISLASGRVVEIHARLGDEVSRASCCCACRAPTSPRLSPTTVMPWP